MRREVARIRANRLPTFDERKLRLHPERWRDLDEAADFETEAFAKAKSPETYSRNDMADFLLEWALNAFWTARGGKPTSPEDREAKLQAEVERVKVGVKARLAALMAEDESSH